MSARFSPVRISACKVTSNQAQAAGENNEESKWRGSKPLQMLSKCGRSSAVKTTHRSPALVPARCCSQAGAGLC